MKWFFEKFKQYKVVVAMIAAIIGTPAALVVSEVLVVADAAHDAAREALGKEPVQVPALEPKKAE